MVHAMCHPALIAGPGGPEGLGTDSGAATVSRMGGRQDKEAATGVVDALDAATRAIASLQSVDDVLQVIVDQVRPLVGARLRSARDRRQAHGVIERFITSGMTPRDASRDRTAAARPRASSA